MFAVKAYFDGNVFVPLTPVSVKLNQSAIVTIIDEAPKCHEKKAYERFIGALSGENYTEIAEALKETQRIDSNEW